MNKSKVFLIVVLLCIAILGSASASAQTTTSTAITSLEAAISQLMGQIKVLEAKIAELKSQVKAAAEELKIERALRMGMSGEDVKKLQEYLAQYPEIYPEGLITGNFGFLTQKAIKKLQSKHKLEEDGVLGPKTICTLKAVFENEAGKSGKMPPGLLIAPGILKKIDCEIKPLAGQILPPGIIAELSTSTPIVCYDDDDDDRYENKKDDDDEEDDDNEDGDGDDDDDKDKNKESKKKEHKEKKLKRKCYFAPIATSTPPVATSTDTTAPIISALTATSTAATSTKIIWNTNESSDSKIWYGASTPISATGTPAISTSTLSLSHQIELFNLTASSTYYYVIGSTDASANAATSSEQSFTTLQ